MQDHMCLKVCEKPLPCGMHNCGLFCHLGSCGGCPVIINEDSFCGCAKTSVPGPQKCGYKVPNCP